MQENSVDVWDDFLNTLEDRGYASFDWEVASDVQEQLIEYFKARIDEGVTDGHTSLPPDLIHYIYRFPKEMRWMLRVYTEGVLEEHPDNGAAAKFLAIETLQVHNVTAPFNQKRTLLEKAMTLLSKDVETCFFAFIIYGVYDEDEAALISLERLFDRLHDTSHKTQYKWVHQLLHHYEVFYQPIKFYQSLKKDDPLIDRWTEVLGKIQNVLEKQLEQEPSNWNISSELTKLYEIFEKPEARQAVLENAQSAFEKELEKKPNDWSTLNVLEDINDKLGNDEKAQEYRLKKDPTIAWEGQVLPDFPSGSVDIEGIPISLAEYRGKVVLLDFWAIWCVPCIGEIPNIKEVYEKYHDKGFEVIFISFDEDEAVVREYIKENDIPWRQILEPEGSQGAIAKQYGVRAIPAPFLIDRDGKVISVKARKPTLNQLVEVEIEGKK